MTNEIYEAKLAGRQQGAIIALKNAISRDGHALRPYMDDDLHESLDKCINEIDRLAIHQIYRIKEGEPA